MNPLILRAVIPYAIAAVIAFGAAWWIQGLRITSAKQKLTDYQQKQTQLIQEAKDAADKQREESRANFAVAVKTLADDIEAGDVYRRCLAAGKCGRVRDVLPTCTGIRLPTAGGNDADRGCAIPTAGESTPPVIIDCAKVQLQLNSLQADIENQPGYRIEGR